MTTTTMCWMFAAMGLVFVAVVFAMRMSYEKYCIRTHKPFRSWLREDESVDYRSWPYPYRKRKYIYSNCEDDNPPKCE